MGKSINKVILIGNLGNDIELKKLPSGDPIVVMAIATTDYQKKTEWHKVILYNKIAIALEKFLQKGTKLYIEGSLRTNKWIDKNNATHYITEIVAANVILLSSNNKNENNIKQNNLIKDEKNTVKKKNTDKNYFNDNFPF